MGSNTNDSERCKTKIYTRAMSFGTMGDKFTSVGLAQMQWEVNLQKILAAASAGKG